MMDDKLVERVARAVFRVERVGGNSAMVPIADLRALLAALTTTADAFNPCEICDDPALCASGKTPCDLCGEFVAPVPADVANKLLNTRTTTADDALRDDADAAWLRAIADPLAGHDFTECGIARLERIASRLRSPSPDGEVTEALVETHNDRAHLLHLLQVVRPYISDKAGAGILNAVDEAMISARSGGGVMMGYFGRVLRTGLSSFRDRAAARLAALRFNPSRLVVNRFGLLSAASGVALASSFYLIADLHAVGMVVACFVALSVGDAWDTESRP